MVKDNLPQVQDLIDKNLQKVPNFDQIEKSNIKCVEFLRKFEKMKEQIKIIPLEMSKNLNIAKQGEVILEITKILLNNSKEGSKISTEQLKPLLDKMNELGMTKMTTFILAKDLLDQENTWKKEVVKQIRTKIDFIKEQKDLKKKGKLSFSRVEGLYKLFQKHDEEHLTIKKMHKFIEEGEALKTNVTASLVAH